MQAWGNKKATETRTRTYVLPASLRAQGIVIAAITSVTAANYDLSSVNDASPSSIINGTAQTNLAPLSINYQPIAANQAVLVSLTGGVTGCTYIVTFTLLLSTGEIFIADCLQYISEYVPTP